MDAILIDRLREALGLQRNERPFPWQVELLGRFLGGTVERSLDIPTGLGKTAVMAIWLIARTQQQALPRRLVYVVDRRAVVDQATRVALDLRDYVDRNADVRMGLGIDEGALPISTLRGQFIDNKEWLKDPASPAIIVGTVDMIGSRLLFEGYAVSRKMRPYHAGLLANDTLLVLDEAHLVPPFQKLIESIADDGALGARNAETVVPPLRVMSLSATGRASAHASFTLGAIDLEHPVVKKRLDAPKHLVLVPEAGETLEDALAKQAWALTDSGKIPARVIVFCDKRESARKTKDAIETFATGTKIPVELFVGGRRVFDREQAARRLEELGFIAGSAVERSLASFVIATSAGEVGVDLDADHMVSDIVAWERMVQRFGRVNRRGDGEAKVVVVVESPASDVQKARGKEPETRNAKERSIVAAADRRDACRRLLEGLANVSPGTLRDLKARARDDIGLAKALEAATTPAPLRPPLSRAVVEAWSMTSLREHTGRPAIGPWLRGWVDEDPPQTTIVWRAKLPVRSDGDSVSERDIEHFFEAAPPHLTETLETETYNVCDWLTKRARALLRSASGFEPPAGMDDVVAFALTGAGELRASFKLRDLELTEENGKKQKQTIEQQLLGAVLVVDRRLAGLNAGLLDERADDLPQTADDGGEWITADPPVVRFRVRAAGADEGADTQWKPAFRFVTRRAEDGTAEETLVVDEWADDAATEEGRSAGRPQLLDEHHSWTEDKARTIGARLGLADEYVDMLALAARAHDEGKRARRWQRAFRAEGDGDYAKTRGPIDFELLDGYRHELGSLLRIASNDALRSSFDRLSPDLRELALHLIAAHHGHARPVIDTSGCEEAPPSALRERAAEIMLRFARLQKQWGPWGLAWWEALLRAADQQASRENDERAMEAKNG